LLWQILPLARGRGNKKNAPIPGYGDEREVRGTTPFRLTNQPIKKPVGAATGRKSQPHLIGYDLGKVYTLGLDNGGYSGAGYSVCSLSPCNSKVHSALSCGRIFHQSTALWPPVRRLLVLFEVFVYYIVLDYIQKVQFVK
jgi:hypothetical protein